MIQGWIDEKADVTYLGQSTLPPIPTNLIATADGSIPTINLDWTDAGDSETAYVIKRGTDGVNFTRWALLPAGAQTYTDSFTTPGQQILLHRQGDQLRRLLALLRYRRDAAPSPDLTTPRPTSPLPAKLAFRPNV